MNLPNKLSLLRISLVPIMVLIAVFLKSETKILGVPLELHLLNIIFIIASITDYLDGKIARKYNLVTDFGKFIDPLADKIVVLSALMILVQFGKISSWVPIIVMTREFAVSGYRLVRAKEGEVVAASMMGKIKTTTQMIGIALMLLSPYAFFEVLYLNKGISGVFTKDPYGTIVSILGSVMMVVSVIATVISGMDYLKNMKEILKDA